MTVALAVSPVNSLVFHSSCIGGMNARCFNDFLAQARQNLDPCEEVIFIYDGIAHYSSSQYRAEDAPSLQPIPAHSGAGNQLTEGSDKRRHIEAPKYRLKWTTERRPDERPVRRPVRRDVNRIATRCSSMLHRCYCCSYLCYRKIGLLQFPAIWSSTCNI